MNLLIKFVTIISFRSRGTEMNIQKWCSNTILYIILNILCSENYSKYSVLCSQYSYLLIYRLHELPLYDLSN